MRVRAFVSGRVQGVGFRDFTRREARRLGLAGYVRNLPDGRVEVLAEGARGTLESLLSVLRDGPPGAWVRGVQVEWSEQVGWSEGPVDTRRPTGLSEFSGFSIL
ncbi:MAG TPA: acylphosphatase [bacterium]|nr:acylphosphatase [bacterium]